MKRKVELHACHDVAASHHPSHDAEIKRINRIAGQVEGIRKMIQQRRYCPEILIQIKAISAAVGTLQGAVLSTHMKHCVQEAFAPRNETDRDKKIAELIKIFTSK